VNLLISNRPESDDSHVEGVKQTPPLNERKTECAEHKEQRNDRDAEKNFPYFSVEMMFRGLKRASTGRA
jgi:hypothetical protein